MVQEIRAYRRMQLDQLPLVLVERSRLLQDRIRDADFTKVVQGGRVEDKVRVRRVPAEMFREYGAVVAESDVVVGGLVVFVADRLVQALRSVEVSLRELTRFFLLALKGLLKLSRVKQQLAVRRR